MPYFITLIGASLWLVGVVKSTALAGNTANWALVNAYSQLAMLGLWTLALGVVWLLLRPKRNR